MNKRQKKKEHYKQLGGLMEMEVFLEGMIKEKPSLAKYFRPCFTDAEKRRYRK